MKTTLEQARELYNLPITTLILRAQQVHHRWQDPAGVQLSTLKSIKTGKCSEDCAYCSQSAHHHTQLEPEKLLSVDTVVADAKEAKAGGASRYCMGAAWRTPPKGQAFETVLDIVRSVKALDLEVCVTLGMLSDEQAKRLKEAGVDVYNHNIDTSREFYPEIITTRTFEDRIDTIQRARAAGMEVCSGGILGMGESVDDRLNMLLELANLDPQPDSVPINALIAVEGTKLEGRPMIDIFEFVRIIAVARILMPKAIVRLSAGRSQMSAEGQALCFLAGANSIFLGEKLLTCKNPGRDDDLKLLERLGMHPMEPDAARRIHQQAAAQPVGAQG